MVLDGVIYFVTGGFLDMSSCLEIFLRIELVQLDLQLCCLSFPNVQIFSCLLTQGLFIFEDLNFSSVLGKLFN